MCSELHQNHKYISNLIKKVTIFYVFIEHNHYTYRMMVEKVSEKVF